MATLTRFSLYSATITDLAAEATTFSQLHGSDIQFGQQVDEEIPGGSIDRVWSMLAFAEPKAGLRTYDLYRAIDTLGITVGLNCSAVFRGRRRADGATFASGSVHATFTAAQGWMGLAGISCRQRQAAEASLVYYATYDASAKPFVFAKTGSSSGMVAPTANTRFYLGPVKLNGTELPDIQGVEINFGLDYQITDGSGSVYPLAGAIYTRKPTITISTPNLEVINTIASEYLATGTNLDVFFRKGAEGDGGRVALATAEHIRIRASSSSLQAQDCRVVNNDDYQTGIMVIPNGTLASSLTEALA